MKQIYHPYWLWECYQNGMWRKETKEYEEVELPKIIEFTGCHNKYGSAMYDVINSWKYSLENFLSNNSINKKAYLGRAACCFSKGWPEYLVRKAWWVLTDTQRLLANIEADKYIKVWTRTKYKNILQIGKKDVTQTVYQMNLL